MASAPENPTYDIVPAADDAAVEHVYQHLKNFWFERHNIPIPDDEKEDLFQQYQQTFYKPERVPLAAMLKDFCSSHGGDEEISFIEIGGANGTTLHYLKSFMDLDRVRYLGIEPFALFRDDFEQNFPDQKIIDGHVEDFGVVDFSSLIPMPVTAVMCFGVLCMTPPRVASAFLNIASELTDDILGFDFCHNFEGTLPPDTQWLFKYDMDHGQIYFVHHFQKYLDGIGFEVVQKIPLPFADGKIGWEVFHFRRRK